MNLKRLHKGVRIGMKKMILIILLGFFGIFGLVSCKTNEEPPVEEQPTERLALSSISLDTSSVKTKYYLGDEFTAEGLKVTINYIKNTEEGPVGVQKPCEEYYLNLDAVDMSHVGKYSVQVIYREGTVNVNNTYDIEVKSSLLDDAGVKYASGLEANYTGELDILLNDEFSFKYNQISFKVHYTQNGEEVEVKNIAYTKVTIDTSNVDTSKIGSYLIKYTFEEDLDVHGTPYKNTVCSFSVVTVSNPATSIELSEGTFILPATLTKLDTSDWKIKITRKKGAPEVVAFSEDRFTLTGVIPYITGNQVAKITLKEDESASLTKEITIVESTTHNIVMGTEFSRYKELENGKVQLDASELIYVTNAVTIADRTSSTGYKDNYKGLITFHDRVTIKGAASYIDVVMEAPGMIVFYYASTGSTVREVSVLDPNGEEVGTFMTAASSAIQEASVVIQKAGTYRIVCLSDQIYVHGCVIATTKA